MGQLDHYHETITRLNIQRRHLGMSYAALAQKSGVSQPTVTRILSGAKASAHFDHVLAIADALGMNLQAQVMIRAEDLLRSRAREKAVHLVSLVQGTSALEAQAVDHNTLQNMIEKTVHELLAGSKRTLWAD